MNAYDMARELTDLRERAHGLANELTAARFLIEEIREVLPARKDRIVVRAIATVEAIEAILDRYDGKEAP